MSDPPATQTPTWPPKEIPSLNGLRAISILLVIVSHAWGTPGFPASLPRWVFDHGWLGVRVFFVISGFLITTLLLSEQAKYGEISLRLFYIRRTLRIFPALYLYVGVMGLLWAAGRLTLQAADFWYGATYTMNYFATPSWQMGHLWSLAVEEQFYFVWPALVRFGGGRRAKLVATWVYLLSPCVLAVMYWSGWSGAKQASSAFPLVADSIACGCLAAFLVSEYQGTAVLERVLGWKWGWLSIGLVALAEVAVFRKRYFYPLGPLVQHAAIAYAVAKYSMYAEGAWGRILNWKPLAGIGLLSYSLYLWQQAFMNRSMPGTWTSFPLNVVCAFGAACGSYFLVERPLQALRKRFQVAK